MKLPTSVWVSGMPLHLRGWNGEYVKSEHDVYHLHPYMYYGILIRPMKIFKKDGRWVLWTNDFFEGEIDSGSEGESPVGEWKNIRVSETNDWVGWWRNNSGLLAGVVVGACSWWFL